MIFANLKNQIMATPNRRRLTLYGGIVGAALLTSVSIFATGPNAAPAAPSERAWPVSVTYAQPSTLHPNFSAFGRLESQRIAHLRSDLVAQISEVLVKEGDWVNQGDVLIRLDQRQAQLRVLERQAELSQQHANLAAKRVALKLEQESAEHFDSNYKIAMAKLARHQDLMAKRLIAKSLLDEVVAQANQASIHYRNHQRELSNLPNEIAAQEASVAKAEALLAYAQLDLEKSAILAPFSGPVLSVTAAPGDFSNLSEPLVEIADANSFEVRVQIPDAYATQFQKLSSLDAISAKTETGGLLKLTRIAQHIRKGQSGLDAFFEFEAGQSAALGRVFNLNIQMPARTNLIAVPVQSIYENNRIYAVSNGRLVGHDIERIGEIESLDHGYAILIRANQLQPGDAIITTALPKAMTGLLVEVANPEQTPASRVPSKNSVPG